MASGGGGGDTTTTVQKADPWEGQQPYLKEGFAEAKRLYNSTGPSYYPNSTVVPFSPETQTALDWQASRALNGSPIQQSATNQLTSTLNGDYLYGGPGFNAAVDAATRKALPSINSAFESAGRTNSGLADVAKTQAISDSFANLYGQERENQMRSMLFAPQVANQDYQDIAALSNVGAQKEALAGNYLQDDMSRYDYNQNLPFSKLQNYMNTIQGNYGGTTSTTSPLYRNQGAGILGGAMTGMSLASQLGGMTGISALGGPMGLIGGGLLGGLMGLF